MVDKLMYISNTHKIHPFVDYNCWLKCLVTQLHKQTNENSIKVPKVIKSTNNEYFKTLGTIVINKSLSLSLLLFDLKNSSDLSKAPEAVAGSSARPTGIQILL